MSEAVKEAIKSKVAGIKNMLNYPDDVYTKEQIQQDLGMIEQLLDYDG